MATRPHRRSALTFAVGAALAAMASGCAKHEGPSPDDRSRDERAVDAAPVAPRSRAAVPLDGGDARASTGAMEPLTGDWVEALGPDFVGPPLGTRGPRPVVVAVHGAGDRPDWACSEWHAVFGAAAFVVCPHGTPVGHGAFAWSSAGALRDAIARAVGALTLRYGARVAGGPRVYAGFSQGAALGASIVQAAPDVYPYAIFLEGLGAVASKGFTTAFRAGGGKRLVLACSRAGCAASRDIARTALDRAQIDARVVYAGNQGHTFNSPVVEALRAVVPWLVEGDPRFFEPAARGE